MVMMRQVLVVVVVGGGEAGFQRHLGGSSELVVLSMVVLC